MENIQSLLPNFQKTARTLGKDSLNEFAGEQLEDLITVKAKQNQCWVYLTLHPRWGPVSVSHLVCINPFAAMV